MGDKKSLTDKLATGVAILGAAAIIGSGPGCSTVIYVDTNPGIVSPYSRVDDDVVFARQIFRPNRMFFYNDQAWFFDRMDAGMFFFYRLGPNNQRINFNYGIREFRNNYHPHGSYDQRPIVRSHGRR